MKLRVIVERLDLTIEKTTKKYGDVFEVSELRGRKIMSYRFNGLPVVEEVGETDNSSEIDNLKQELKKTSEANQELELKNQELEDLLKEFNENKTDNLDSLSDESVDKLNKQNKKEKEVNK